MENLLATNLQSISGFRQGQIIEGRNGVFTHYRIQSFYKDAKNGEILAFCYCCGSRGKKTGKSTFISFVVSKSL